MPNTPQDSFLPNVVSPKDTLPREQPNDLFGDESTADTVSITDDESMHSLNTHDSDSDTSEDAHGSHGIYEEDNLKEIMYEIPVLT